MAAYGKSTGKSIGGLCPVERLKSAATSRSLRLEKHVSLTSGFSMAADSAKSAKVSKQISQFRELLDYFEHGIINQDPTVVGIVVAIALVLLTMLFLLFRSKASQRRGVLLIGLCDSGKTLIFSRLIHNRFANSHTSIKENVGSYKTGKNSRLQLVDLPGHERLLSQKLDQYRPVARAVIFVVDSLTFQKDVKDVAETLYTVLTDSVLSHCSVLIACNKQDMTLSKGAKLIQSQLEKELNTVRTSRSATLQGTSSTGTSSSVFLGKRDKPFQFSDLRKLNVTFVECSAKGKGEEGEAQLSEVIEWLDTVA